MFYRNEYMATVPFDLYGLTLFHLVAERKSFTGAAQGAGLTQSAVSRRVDDMEKKLGVRLFDRTTRQVRLTSAGEELYSRTRELLNTTEEILHTFQKNQNLQTPVLRIGIARSIGLAYLPGFFFAFQKKFSAVQLRITQESSRDILRIVEEGQLDAGLVCLPKSLPRGLVSTHRFQDDFTLILPRETSLKSGNKPLSLPAARTLTSGKEWLCIDSQGYTGKSIQSWLGSQKWKINSTMELDSFDMILNLVSLGMGVSLVPSRVLALYGQRRAVQRVSLKTNFTRTLAVVIQKRKNLPEHLQGFIENILF